MDERESIYLALLRRKGRADGRKARLGEEGALNNQRKPDRASEGESEMIRRQTLKMKLQYFGPRCEELTLWKRP